MSRRKKAEEPQDQPQSDPQDQRAPDQDGAMEVAFVEGALPEEDRRLFSMSTHPVLPDTNAGFRPATMEEVAQFAVDANPSLAEPKPTPPSVFQPDHWESLSGRPMTDG